MGSACSGSKNAQVNGSKGSNGTTLLGAADAKVAKAAVEAVSLTTLLGATLLTKDGEASTAKLLDGKKHVMLYFSAHWCPPCRGFTPVLAKAYEASARAGVETVVVFVSSDQDQKAFDQYYSEMPWFALPYAARDLKDKLSARHGVQGIPSLIVLDGEGGLVTKDGRAQYATFLDGQPSALPQESANGTSNGASNGASSAFVTLLGETLTTKEGEAQTADVLAGKTHVMLYFSAHWCPPCRGFTPQLATAYKGSAKGGSKTAVVFVSSDRDEAAFNEYFGEMPWCALPFARRDLKGTLSEKYEVQGIPTLVVLNGNAELVTKEGRGEFKRYL